MLETFREHSQSQGFRLRQCLVRRFAVGKNTGKLRDLCDPTAVLFLLVLDGEGDHVLDSTLSSGY